MGSCQGIASSPHSLEFRPSTLAQRASKDNHQISTISLIASLKSSHAYGNRGHLTHIGVPFLDHFGQGNIILTVRRLTLAFEGPEIHTSGRILGDHGACGAPGLLSSTGTVAAELCCKKLRV